MHGFQDARLWSQGGRLAIHRRSAERPGLSTSTLSQAPEELRFQVALQSTPYLSAGARCLLGNVVSTDRLSDLPRITFFQRTLPTEPASLAFHFWAQAVATERP